MAATMGMTRSLAGKAFTMVQAKPVKQVSNGAKYFMKRRDSYMVEVNVADTETEDQAVRRYMKAVVQSGVINKLRARRTKETKIETYKRKLAERAQARKLGIEEPTWEEFYGNDVEEAKPFDEFFTKPSEDDADSLFSAGGDLPLLDGQYFEGQMYNLDGYNSDPAYQAGYNSDPAYQAGYLNNPQDQGGYINAGRQDQGGYINQQPGETFTYTAQQLQQQPPQQQY